VRTEDEARGSTTAGPGSERTFIYCKNGHPVYEQPPGFSDVHTNGTCMECFAASDEQGGESPGDVGGRGEARGRWVGESPENGDTGEGCGCGARPEWDGHGHDEGCPDNPFGPGVLDAAPDPLTAEEEMERLRVQLAGCSVAALGGSEQVSKGDSALQCKSTLNLH